MGRMFEWVKGVVTRSVALLSIIKKVVVQEKQIMPF